MFKRALNMFYRSAAEAEADSNDGVDDTPPPPLYISAATADEIDLEQPLLLTTNDDSESQNDVENPPSPTTNDGSKTPKSSNRPRYFCGCSATKIHECLVFGLVFLALLGIPIYYFVKEVNHIYDDPGFKIDSVAVASFNVSKTFPKTRWDTELSLGLPEGDFSDLGVRYEAPRLWLYSGDEGFVSTTSSSMKYSSDCKDLVMHAVFGVQEGVGRRRVVRLDLLMESNAISSTKIHSSGLEIKSFLMIGCYNLKIEFDEKFGTLVEGGKSCRVEICPIQPHPLYDGADACTN